MLKSSTTMKEAARIRTRAARLYPLGGGVFGWAVLGWAVFGWAVFGWAVFGWAVFGWAVFGCGAAGAGGGVEGLRGRGRSEAWSSAIVLL
jgi:hypothetical protein